MLSEKRSDLKHWFDSLPRKANTRREAANLIHAYSRENKQEKGHISTENRPHISSHNWLNT
jgi:hypothetical protein